MCSEGKRRYDTVQAINKKLRTQGAWRKKKDRITQGKACRDAGISEHQFRTWSKIINGNGDKSLDDVYSALEDKRYAPNKLSSEEEEMVRKFSFDHPDKSCREVARLLEERIGRKLHHSTVSRIINL